MMQLSVKTLDSLTHNFTDLDEEITVVQFKSHISSTVTLPPEQQRLIFRGRVLQDDKKLRDYNVTSGQVIHLVARNPAQSTLANDHPQPQLNTQPPSGGGGGGRNNTFIMGTIGTLEFSNPRGPNAGPVRRRSAAAARLTVANHCLTRASNLLQTLEDEVSLLPQQPAPEGVEHDDDEAAVLESIALQHAATTATIMASVHQHPPGQPQAPPTGNSTSSATNGSGQGQSGAAPTSGQNGTQNTGSPAATARAEAPPLHELATCINDMMALNSRLTPYLQTVQRWLVENGDFGENRASTQYTYNTVSSVLHSLSHSIHALSDLTVDFSLPPAQRRLRAPSTVWVEQSPVVRATIPIGVQIGVEAVVPNTNPNTGAPPNPTGTPPGQVFGGQGVLPGNAGGVPAMQQQIQQVISSIIQGVMSGQMSEPPQQPNATPQPPASNIDNNNSQSAPNTAPNPFGNFFPPQGFQIPVNLIPGAGGGAGPTPQFGTAVPNISQPGGMRATRQPVPIPIPVPPATAAGATGTSTDSIPRRPLPSLEQMILQCRSHHYPNPALPRPQRPENLSRFLARETQIPVGAETLVFDTATSLMQGLNLTHPILAQYFRATLLRGRDSTNAGHVTTAVRVYARKLVSWIVTSIAATRSDFNQVQLTAKLVEAVTQLMSKATQIILATPATSPVTPKLGPLLNEFMPEFLNALDVFPPSEHISIFKGIILLIVNSCFPGTSVVFTTRLAAGIYDYLSSCQATRPESETESDNVEAEISMEIDVEFEDALDIPQVEAQMGSAGEEFDPNRIFRNSVANNTGSTVPSMPTPSTSAVPLSTLDFNTAQASSSTSGSKTVETGSGNGKKRVAPADNFLDSDDDEEEMHAELQRMTGSLFRDVPEPWHETLLLDIQRQEALRQNPPPEPSPGFLSIFPRK